MGSLVRWLGDHALYTSSTAHLNALHVGNRYETPTIRPSQGDAEVVPHVPPPPPPPPGGSRVGRRGKGRGKGRSFTNDGTSYHWGPFVISRVNATRDGQRLWIGMGITCGLHNDNEDTENNICQTALHFKTVRDLQLDEAEATLRLKRWVYAGHAIRDTVANARTRHKQINARAFVDGIDEDFLDGWALSM